MLRSKIVKFLMSVLSWQVDSSSNFAPFFIIMTHNSPIKFRLVHFLLWKKACHQSPNFETLKYSGKKLRNFPCHLQRYKSDFLQFLYQPWVVSNILSKLKNYILWSKAFHYSVNFFRFLSARVKILETPYVNYEMTSQFFFRFFITLHCHYT